MKKIVFTFLMCFIILSIGRSQDDNNTKIGVKVYSDASIGKQDVDHMYRLAEYYLNDMSGFAIIERANMRKIFKERELQKGEEYTDVQIAEQGKALGVDYIFQIEMSNYNCSRGSCSYNHAMKIVNVENGKLKNGNAHTISVRTQGVGSPKNQLYQKTGYFLNKFLKKTFPPTMQIVEVLKSKGKKAKMVLVGSDMKVPKSYNLIVFELEEIEVDGEVLERHVDIGKVAFRKREGENFVECEVLDGAKMILEKFNSKTPLYVRKYSKKKGLEKLLYKAYESN